MLRILNFLPDDYMHRRRVRRANIICALVAVGGLLLVGVAVGLTAVRAIGMAATRDAVDRQYEKASRRIKDLQQLEERKTGLLHKAELSATLLERVPRSHILGRLTNHLPTETSLTSLSMEPQEMRVEKPAPKAEAADNSKKGNKKVKPPKQTETRLRFRLDGLAETDVQVAEYMSRLSADPLFERVDLQFSEEFPYEEGVTMRRFQLSFVLSKGAAKALEQAPLRPGTRSGSPRVPTPAEEAS